MTDKKTPMQVIRNSTHLERPLPASVVTIGNFDGVHLAHQELLRCVVRAARELKAWATVVTFDPHPAQVLAPQHAPKILTPLDKKVRLIEQEGIDLVWVLPFSEEIARLSPADFVQTILVDQLRPAEVHVGMNFRFGHNREGNTSVLAELGLQNNFRVRTLSLMEVRGERVSSTRIRELLAEGKVHVANRLLGRPFAVWGPIAPGEGVGREQTVPTLNLASTEQQLPACGVYVTRTWLAGASYPSVSNIGYKPTFGPHPLTIETYLLDFSGEISAAQMEVEFLYRLRAEIKFPHAADLKAQIQKDIHRSMRYFQMCKRLRHRPAQQDEAPPVGKTY